MIQHQNYTSSATNRTKENTLKTLSDMKYEVKNSLEAFAHKHTDHFI